CTNCSTVFFVAQEVTHPRIKIDLDRVVTIGCPSCDAQYQFPARDIPPGGYDAECNKCHAVFFVSDDEGAAERYQMIGSPDPVEEPQPDLQLPEHGTSDVISADTQPNGELPEDTSPNAELPATDDLDDTASDVTVDTSPNAQMPEPDPLDGVADLTDADPSDEEFEESDSEVTEQQTMKVRLRDVVRESLQDDEPEELTDAEFEEIPEADSSLLEDITGIDPFDDSLTVPEPPLPESVAVQQPVRRQTAPNPVMPEPIETDRVAAFDGVDDDLDIDFGTHRGTKGLVVAAIAAMALAVSDRSAIRPRLTELKNSSELAGSAVMTYHPTPTAATKPRSVSSERRWMSRRATRRPPRFLASPRSSGEQTSKSAASSWSTTANVSIASSKN
ncbi:MAG: zinc-ribbon domain-containing protein, partial [Myxococcota bacterium]